MNRRDLLKTGAAVIVAAPLTIAASEPGSEVSRLWLQMKEAERKWGIAQEAFDLVDYHDHEQFGWRLQVGEDSYDGGGRWPFIADSREAIHTVRDRYIMNNPAHADRIRAFFAEKEREFSDKVAERETARNASGYHTLKAEAERRWERFIELMKAAARAPCKTQADARVKVEIIEWHYEFDGPTEEQIAAMATLKTWLAD